MALKVEIHVFNFFKNTHFVMAHVRKMNGCVMFNLEKGPPTFCGGGTFAFHLHSLGMGQRGNMDPGYGFQQVGAGLNYIHTFSP